MLMRNLLREGVVAEYRWKSFIQFLCEVYQTPAPNRQALADELLASPGGFPWVERNKATFVFDSPSAQNVALNIDIVNRDPPFETMIRLEDTNLWYFQRHFERDALVDYMFAVDDPGTPLAQELDLMQRVGRHWLADPLNAQSIQAQSVDTSILQMPRARPVPNWRSMPGVPRGRIYRYRFSSTQLNFSQRSLWVYTPPDYDAAETKSYRLLIMLDGQWAINALEAPYIADALIKHGRMQPIIMAMLASGSQPERLDEYIGNEKHYAMLAAELLPFLQAEHRIQPLNLGLGGVGEGAVAAAHAALKNPAIFEHLIMISPPLGSRSAVHLLKEVAERFRDLPILPNRIFHSVGRYEHDMRYVQPALALRGILERRMLHDPELAYRFIELGSGHSLAAFKSILPEALAHAFPPES